MSLAIGDELGIKLQTVGPGEYSSPPAITGSAVRFLGVALVGPYVPAGPTQVFRFKAVALGQAIIQFEHTDRNPAVNDTVVVR